MSALPNYLSMLRIALVLPITWLLWQHQVMSAFWLMLIAGFSDALDGFLARRYGWQTELGTLLDPLADKFLIAAMYLVFTLQGLIPLWLVALILTRDILILLGAGVYRGVFGDLTVNPSLLSKTNTALQILVVLMLMVSQMPIGDLGPGLLTFLQAYTFPALAALCIASGCHYLFVWGRHSWRRLRGEQSQEIDDSLEQGDSYNNRGQPVSEQAVLPIDAPHQPTFENFVVGDNAELCDTLKSQVSGFSG